MKQIRRILLWQMLLGCFLITGTTARAQFQIKSWTTDDGLPQNSVRAMLQTSDGYLWMTTLDGLVRFDGIRFTVFNKTNSKNLPGNRFINLFAENAGLLWICTEEQGVIRRSGGEFRAFTTDDGLPSNYVLEVGQDADGNLLAYTAKGTARFDGNRFSPLAPENYGYKHYLAPSGAFWELNAQTLSGVKNGQKRVYDLPADLRRELSPDYDFYFLARLYEDSGGALWMTTNHLTHNRLFKLTGEKIEEIKTENLPTSLISDAAQDRRGDLWIATINDGACRLNRNRFACYKAEAGLADNISRIFKDRENTLWMATDSRGFFRLTEQVISPLSVAQGLAGKNAYTIFEDRTGAIWVGSYLYLARYKDGEFTNYGRSDGLIYSDVQSIYEDADGRLWVGALAGIQYLENGKFYDFKPQLDAKIGSLSVFDIHRDRNGIMWFASNVGLFRYDGAATLLTTADGLPGNNVKAILETDDGSFWIATYDGIARFKDGKFTAYTEKDGLAGNHVRALYKDETGTLWIGTYDSGLSRFKDGKFTNYTIESGLSSNGAFQITEDRRKNFWISSNQGIYRVSREQLNEFADGARRVVTSTLFGKSDGMLNAEANGGGQPAGTRASDGRLWFPTQDGVAVVNPEAVAVNPLPPPVVIESVRIDNVLSEPPAIAGGSTRQSELPDKVSGGNLQPPAAAGGSDIVIQPGQENLEIDYTGLSFVKPEQIRFRYRLEGLDENWTEAGTRRTAFYPYLPPGNYTFRVVAANSDNVWNTEGAIVSITVLPPFYRTAWFVGLMIFGLAAIGFALYKWRVSALESRRRAQEEFSRRLINAHEAERSRVAAELHDSIGQTLAMIKNRAAFAAQTDDDSTAKEQLAAIQAQTTQAIGEVRQISYNLRPYLLENLGLTKAIKSLIAKIEEVHLLEIDARICDVDDLFSGEAEMSVYRIVQESLNNVAKHSEADAAALTIEKTNNVVTIEIADDGRGFDRNAAPKTDAAAGGFGLLGIAERVRMLGGALDIQTGKGSGTKLTIKIRAQGRIIKDG